VLDFDRTYSLITRLTSSDDAIICPHCGHAHRISDPDVCSNVVSYWGDDLHDLSCDGCAKDFVVRERVTRHFTAVKTADDLESV